MSDFPINESSNASSSSSSPEGGLRVVNPDVKVSTVEDFKKVLIENTATGKTFTAYDYMMEQFGIAAAKQAQKDEEHRKKVMKELQQE